MDDLLTTYKVRLWEKRLLDNGIAIDAIEELYSKYTNDNKLLFALVNAHATTPEGNKLLPLCFIKGEVVCVLVCLIDTITREKYLLLVRQRRICDGSLTYEHPAGMLDNEADPVAVGLREVLEETGIEVNRNQIIELNKDTPYFPTTGTSDEAMYLLYCELELSKEKIQSLDGALHGEASEHEFITTHVYPFEEGYKLIKNTNGLLHCFLYLKHVGDWDLIKKL